MQSQQKRVKWSRGETAEALEERTDTGITQASVEHMENCIPDIYGNISRRPGLKIVPYGSAWGTTYFGFLYDQYLQVIPFYLTETDYILIGVHYHSVSEFLRIKNGKVVSRYTLTGENYPKTGVELNGVGGLYTYRPISYAQQGNYLLVADGYNVWKITISGLNDSDDTFTANCEVWQFSAGWYSPNGTGTRTVDNQTVTGLSISGTFTKYPYTDPAGNSTIYSYANTNVDSSNLATLEEQIPVGSIIQLPNIGTYFRVEGYTFGSDNENSLAFPTDTFDGVLGPNDAVPSTGKYCKAVNSGLGKGILQKYVNGNLVEQITAGADVVQFVQNTGSQTGFSKGYFKITGHYFQTTWQGWSNADPSALKIAMFGELLTPVADDTQTDTSVSVEYGYQSLQPQTWGESTFPHPLKLAFVDQRLWAGSWAYSIKDQYSLVVGSQIARYNDLKNDYNQENEPITLDILTKFKEKIVHLIDYNGLKIMTDAYEYAVDEKLIKQSANGSFEYCEPIVFDSLCLYVDSTGCQVKAMQYEFQANIFNSSTINQLAPKKLVWYPWSMAQYEDKYNDTGKYLFLVNREDAEARVAVCNFVPSNQANIWNRWTFPQTDLHTIPLATYASMIHSIVNMKDGALFMLTLNSMVAGTAIGKRIVPAILDFDANTDLDSPLVTDGTYNYFAPIYEAGNISNNALTMTNTEVAVYSDGEFKFNTTTGNFGQITADLTGLTNITLGLPINAKVVSHPIDVGGKTKSIKKRIAKTVLSVHGTEPGAITINGKTGYMNPQKDKINFYGVTGMKDEIKYTLTNNNGAMFHLESLLMNIEYGTLIS